MVSFPDQSLYPPLVLLHGFCESNAIFDDLLPHLQKRYQVIAPNLPGHGQTTFCPEIKDMKGLADWLRDAVAAHTQSPFVLVGHSLGGYISAAFAHHHPERLRGLMMLHSTAFGDAAESRAERVKRIEFIERHGPKNFYPRFLKSLFPKGNPAAIELLEPIVRNTTASTITQYSRIMISRPNQVPALAGLQVPLHCFAGEEDAFIPLERIQQEKAVLPNAAWKILPGIGHMGMYEAPEKLLQAIDGLMEKVKA